MPNWGSDTGAYSGDVTTMEEGTDGPEVCWDYEGWLNGGDRIGVQYFDIASPRTPGSL